MALRKTGTPCTHYSMIHRLQVFCPGMTGGIRVAGQRGGDIDSTC
jgi:hypothetical protein